MSRGKNSDSGRPKARSVARYTIYNVTEPAELMDFLMRKMAGISRSKVKALLANRVILVDNVITTQYNFALKPGMKVQISKVKNNREFKHPMLKLVYEDAYILVVEKKEGLLSVSTEHQKERTAQHILNEYVKRSHRFKDEKTQNTLRDNWHDIVTDRRYVSIVSGDMEKDYGTVESWLTDRKLYVYSSPVDNGEGKFAVTHYKTIKRANGYSLVELDLETGRKNQIRVHMLDLGHPVVGDRRYGSECDPLGRLALHAFKLCFYHPVTKELMEFETPYPTAFKGLMQKK